MNEIYGEVIQDLRVRLDWENRQMIWSRVPHEKLWTQKNQ
jgi:hypothetical protein